MPGLRRTRPLPVAAPTPTAPVRPRFRDAGPGDSVFMGKDMIAIPKGMPVPPGFGQPQPRTTITPPSTVDPFTTDPVRPMSTPPTGMGGMAPPTGLGMTPPTGMAKGGKVASASKRADGIAQRGKTKGKMY